jgi:hypothetical protein
MAKRLAVAVALAVGGPAAAQASSIEKALAKLPPEYRSHQACILRGLDAVKREPVLRKADRMKTSIFSQAVLDGTKLTARGGAVRSGGHWYALSFSCDLTSDWMKATSFSFALGPEIAEKDWDRLGLWR